MTQPNEPRYNQNEPETSGPPWRLIIFGVVVAVTVIFILQNRERRNVDFLFFEVKTRVWTSLLIALVLGVILDRLFLSWWRRRRERRDT